MKEYLVTARDGWDAELEKRFGSSDTKHQLSGNEIVDAIVNHGRAEIRFNQILDCWEIEFQNGYD